MTTSRSATSRRSREYPAQAVPCRQAMLALHSGMTGAIIARAIASNTLGLALLGGVALNRRIGRIGIKPITHSALQLLGDVKLFPASHR
jgi:hypothetical protein